jgi:hypothetical protein
LDALSSALSLLPLAKLFNQFRYVFRPPGGVRGVSLTGLGKRPDLQPSHQVLLLTGTMARTCGRRRKPEVGMFVVMISLLEYFQEANHGFLKQPVTAGKADKEVNLYKSQYIL